MIKVYNTLSRKKEGFISRKPHKVNLFVCGVTTYDFSHIGHARTYVVFDTIVKFLMQKGFDVFYLQNITDIDNKIIQNEHVKEVFGLTGEHDLLLKLKFKDIEEFNEFVRLVGKVKLVDCLVELPVQGRFVADDSV